MIMEWIYWVLKKHFIVRKEGNSPTFQSDTWWTCECISKLLWDVIRWEHALQEGVEKNKRSLRLESWDRVASSPHRCKREASLVLLNIASNLQPAVTQLTSKNLKSRLNLNLLLRLASHDMHWLTSLSGVYQGRHGLVTGRLRSLTEYLVALMEHTESMSPLKRRYTLLLETTIQLQSVHFWHLHMYLKSHTLSPRLTSLLMVGTIVSGPGW
jgi:hypothetical protein